VKNTIGSAHERDTNGSRLPAIPRPQDPRAAWVRFRDGTGAGHHRTLLPGAELYPGGGQPQRTLLGHRRS